MLLRDLAIPRTNQVTSSDRKVSTSLGQLNGSEQSEESDGSEYMETSSKSQTKKSSRPLSPVHIDKLRVGAIGNRPQSDIKRRKQPSVRTEPNISSLYKSIHELDHNPSTQGKVQALPPTPLISPTHLVSPSELSPSVLSPPIHSNPVCNQHRTYEISSIVNFQDIKSIFNGLRQDEILSQYKFILHEEKNIVFMMKGYSILVEHTNSYRYGFGYTTSFVNISLVNKFNKFFEVEELGFSSVFKTCTNYSKLVSMLSEIVTSGYNIECFYEIRKIGQELIDIGYDVDMTWSVSIMIETDNINLHIEISYPSFTKGNRGVEKGDPVKPQVIKAEFLNLNHSYKPNKKIRWGQKTKHFNSSRELIKELEMYRTM